MSEFVEEPRNASPRWRGAWRCLLLAAVMLPFPWVRVSCVETKPDGTKSVGGIVTQTGIQATYGGASLDQGAGNGPLDALFPKANPVPAQALNVNGGPRTDSQPQSLMILYVISLVSGIAGVWLFADRDRPKMVRAASVAALLTLGIQSGSGLPLVSKTAAAPARNGPGGVAIEVVHTPWYWVALGATVGSVVFAFVEFGPKPVPRAERMPRNDWPGVA